MKVNEKLHINTVTLTVFFENLIKSEPVVLNIIRDGVPIIDTGFFAPLKVLLLKGKFKPTAEAILNAASRVSSHMTLSKLNILSAFQELYLSMLDASQATLMTYGIVAPSPKQVPTMLKSLKIPNIQIRFFKEMQTKFKKIEHKELFKLTGKQFDSYLKNTIKYNKIMEKKLKKKL